MNLPTNQWVSSLQREDIMSEYTVKNPGEPASEAQRNFIRKLRDERNLNDERMSEAQREYLLADDFSEMLKGHADAAIKLLLKLDKKRKVNDKPVQVSQPIADGHSSKASYYFIVDPIDGKEKFVTVWMSVRASDDMYPVTNPEHRNAMIQAIGKDPVQAMNAYGEKLGICGRCGRTLTDRDSRLRGIGPICAQHIAAIRTPEQDELLDRFLASKAQKEEVDGS
jgi:hypothetical protein